MLTHLQKGRFYLQCLQRDHNASIALKRERHREGKKERKRVREKEGEREMDIQWCRHNTVSYYTQTQGPGCLTVFLTCRIITL